MTITLDGQNPSGRYFGGKDWPLPNVWLGTSVEDQKRADERIPHLLRCPSGVRFLSVEPLLADVNLQRVKCLGAGFLDALDGRGHDGSPSGGRDFKDDCAGPSIDWVIVGGESGAGARRFDVLWAESIIGQCRGAAVPCFVKQLGSKPFIGDASDPHGWPTEAGPVNWETGKITLKSGKGGDMDEWPADLRVREFPRCLTDTTSSVGVKS